MVRSVMRRSSFLVRAIYNLVRDGLCNNRHCPASPSRQSAYSPHPSPHAGVRLLRCREIPRITLAGCYLLPGLDTLTPTLIVGDGLKMIGEYKETVGTCYAFSESDAPPKSIHDGMAPPKENKGKQASNSKEAPARSKAVKHLSSVQKILKFRSIGEDHQDYRAYLDKDK
ncbi:uncharacterized protein [Lolium perenne]|uniref:uncharacterized protein isoform X2 n=1 Tax=Lolium perenne TaxID=4522 RepID=UPI003A9A27BD